MSSIEEVNLIPNFKYYVNILFSIFISSVPELMVRTGRSGDIKTQEKQFLYKSQCRNPFFQSKIQSISHEAEDG